MPKRSKAQKTNAIPMVSEKFRTTPIKSTITRISGLPKSAILYRCEASSYWQFRVFMEGKQRKRSTKEEELAKATKQAKLIYSEMLTAVNSGETKSEPTSRKTLQTVAKSLWAKNETRVKNKELHKDKVEKDKYVFERHIWPFFKEKDVKHIDGETLEEFKTYLANKDLSPATQLSYIQLVMSLLNQALLKRFIAHVPPKPRVRVDDEARGYFNETDYRALLEAAFKNIGTVYEFKNATGRVYRRTRITPELYLLIDFMVQTYVRPTDIGVLRHRHVHEVVRNKIKFIELRHPSTKRHRNHMLGTELALNRYQSIIEYRKDGGMFAGMDRPDFEEEPADSFETDAPRIGPDDYIFAPEMQNRETALNGLATQFTALLEIAGLRQDAEGKPRTLYSLRHTAIVHSIHKGLPLEMIAANARTSSEMIRRFYGSHVKSVLYMGSAFIEAEEKIRNTRYDKVNELAKEIGVDFDAYADDE
jgi:integrase